MAIAHITKRVQQEFFRSMLKHGGWHKLNQRQMFEKILDEMQEVKNAMDLGDIHGEHGVLRELEQVANCAMKMVLTIEGRATDDCRGQVGERAEVYQDMQGGQGGLRHCVRVQGLKPNSLRPMSGTEGERSGTT